MDYKEKFVRLMLEAGVLKFGEFKTKSGRLSPYFINTGNYSTGRELKLLGEFYADLIMDKFKDKVDFLYGPAYKGIPLAAAVSIALYNKYNIEMPYCFNRKEAKDHGEGGVIVAYQPKDGDRALIIEDVITAGTSVRESVPILKAKADVHIGSMVISVDRMEKGYNGKTAISEVKEEFNIDTYPIVSVKDIIEILYNKEIDGKIIMNDAIKASIEAYMAEYCVTE